MIAQFGIVDKASLEYTESGFKRALITYGIARGLNGVISVAQGTEVAIEPVGVGLTFTPGEILDPVNDLIERFSWIVLASGTSLGIQRVLLKITSWQAFTILVSTATLISLLLLWWRGNEMADAKKVIYRLTCVFLILRFAVPVIALASESIYELFLAPMYENSTEQLEQISLILKDLNEQDQTTSSTQQGDEQTFLESARQKLLSVTRQINIHERLDAFKLAAEKISETTINLIVIFVIQNIMFPLLFAWLFLQLIKWVIFHKGLPGKLA